MSVFARIRSMRWWQKSALAIAVVLVLYTGVGFLLVPVILKDRLEQDLAEALDRHVSVEDVNVNPFLLSLQVEGMRITEPDGSAVFASLSEGFLDLGFATLYRWYPVVKALSLKEPFFHLVRNEDGTFNLPAPGVRRDEEEDDSSEPLRFAVHNMEIDRGEVRFLDRPSDREHVLKEIRLAVPFVSNAGEHVETWVEPSFSAVLNESGVSVAGRSKPFVERRTTRVRLSLQGVELPDYMVYAPRGTGLDVTSGRLGLDAEVSFLNSKDKDPDVEISADLRVDSLTVEQPGKPARLHLSSVRARIESLKPLRRTLTIGSVALLEPELRLHRNEAGALAVGSGSGTTPPPADPGGKGWAVQLQQASVEDGAFFFTDASAGEPFSFTLDPFDLEIRNLGNKKDTVASYAFSGAGKEGPAVEAEGEVTLVPFSSEGRVAVSGVTVSRYRPYYQNILGLEILEGGLDVDGRYRLAVAEAAPALELSEVGCRLIDLKAANGGDEEVVRIPRLRVEGGRLTLQDREVWIRSAAVKDGFVSITRRKDGSLNLEAFARTPEETAEEEKTAPPWSFTLRKGTVENHEILFEDRQTGKPVRLRVSSIGAEVEGLTSDEEGEASVAVRCRLDRDGSLEASGTLDLVPLKANLAVEADGIGLPLLQPYFDHPNLRLASAELSAAGDLAWSMEQDQPVVSYTGRSGVSGFSLVERENGQELISFRSTELSGLDLGNHPARFHLDNLKVQGLETSIIISEKGRLNLVQAFSRKQADRGRAEKEPDKPSPKKKQDNSAETVRIETVRFEEGRISFRDDHIEPGVQAELRNIGGTVTGLSSQKDSRAEVDLQGSVTGDAAMEIVGNVGPLSEGLYVDVALELNNAAMVQMNPYAKQYVGYAIEKGNMSLDLDYLIDRNRLESRNRILLDQLTLGEKVESAAAVDLPVKFAVALLKDRQGRINLSIPVQGDLSDPQTDLGEVIRKAVFGFLRKVISAPFSFLGKLFGGGEELRHIEFSHGSSDLTAEARKKLQTLIQVLGDRPQLGVSLTGYVDPEKDSLALAEEKVMSGLEPDHRALEEEGPENLEDALVVRAFRKKFCGDEETGEKQALEPAEIRRLLGTDQQEEAASEDLQALFQRRFCHPTIDVGARFPIERMKRLLVSATSVPEKELRHLARARAQTVQRALLEDPDIGPGRLFLEEAGTLSPENKDEVSKSRVRLELEAR